MRPSLAAVRGGRYRRVVLPSPRAACVGARFTSTFTFTSTVFVVSSSVNLDALGSALGGRFVEIGHDAEAQAFEAAARARPHGPLALGVRAVLTRFVSDFDANGILGIHSMHLLSTDAWRKLLGDGPFDALLDVGAGDGSITATLAPLARRVITTELSKPMARRLRRRGYACEPIDLAAEPLPEPAAFDLVTALNVIDRCARPVSLLVRLAELLAPSGRLVVAAPLPLTPHVHVGASTVDPDELLVLAGEGFEQEARSLYERVLEPLGLRVDAFSRAPYLCRGGRSSPVIALDDAIFVLRRAP